MLDQNAIRSDPEKIAADRAHGVVDAVAGEFFQQIHDEFALIPDVHEHAVVADDVAGNTEPQEVRVQALKLSRDDTDVVAAFRHFKTIQFFHGESIREGMGV